MSGTGDGSTGDERAGLRQRAAARVGARRRSLEELLTTELDEAWPLDVINAVTIVVGAATHSVVIAFHVVFVVQAVAAIVLPFRRFAIRLCVWTGISLALVAWSVIAGYVPAVELSELPLLTTVLVLVYLGAQARGRIVTRLRIAQAELVERSENEVEALHHQLEQAQRLELLGRASQSVAHDLRNVFTVINGCVADVADTAAAAGTADTLGDGHVRECVLQIKSATSRGLGIVSDLLETGRQRPDVEAVVDLGDLIEHLEPLLRRLTPPTVALRIDRPVEPVRARVDRTGVLQVLMNLVVNATEAITGHGTVAVTCARVVRQRPGGTPRAVAVLTVADDGPGIPSGVMGTVFESGVTTKSDDHSGIGLTTVWRIVERWDGAINIDSSAWRGTTVSVELPVVDEAVRRRALVVVADPTARSLLASDLIGRDFDVTESADPLEACDLIADLDPLEVVLLDEGSATDESLRHVAALGRAPCVSVLPPNGDDPDRRLPRDPVTAAAVVTNALDVARPTVR